MNRTYKNKIKTNKKRTTENRNRKKNSMQFIISGNEHTYGDIL